MLKISFVLLLLTAVGGLIMAGKLFNREHPPWVLSVGHAALGAIALVLLTVGIVQGDTTQRVLVALIILIAAALGGFYLAALHANTKLPPKVVVAAHGLLAVTGVLLLGSSLL